MVDEYRFEDFEPTAAKAANEAPNNFSIASISAMSMAISAKRQADALDRIERHLGQLAGELADPEYGVGPTLRKMRFD